MTIAYQSLRKILAFIIIEVLDKSKNQAGCKPEFIISWQDLSNIMGIANESLIRALSDFKTEKRVNYKGAKIVIPEEKKLWDFLY